MKSMLSYYRYPLLCGLLILCHFADILSTDYIRFYGDGRGVEANPVAAALQADSSTAIWSFRIAVIAVFIIGLFVVRISEEELKKLKYFSTGRILLGRTHSLPDRVIHNITFFSIIAALSINRLFAATSNLTGEFFHISIPIIASNIFQLQELRHIYILSSLISSALAMLTVISAWEIYRKT